MKNLIRILAAISIVLLIGFSTGCSNSTENSQDKITVGAIRWLGGASQSMAQHQFYQPIMEVKEGTQEVLFPEYPPETYLTDLFSAEGTRFITRHQDEPFFLYLSYNAPHMPLQAREEDMEQNSHIKDEKRRIFAEMMTALDRGIGQILETLELFDIKDNTLVVFLSDNGAPHPDHPGTNKSKGRS